jgi:hypothetical protein
MTSDLPVGLRYFSDTEAHIYCDDLIVLTHERGRVWMVKYNKDGEARPRKKTCLSYAKSRQEFELFVDHFMLGL